MLLPREQSAKLLHLIPEAGTAMHDVQIVGGGSGDTDFPYLSGIKPIATVGEYDAVTGRVLTGIQTDKPHG